MVGLGSMWLSLIGPKLEARTKIREAGSQQPSPNHSGVIISEAVLWFPGSVSTEVVGKNYSPHMIFSYGFV